jgi:hypothetical protein
MRQSGEAGGPPAAVQKEPTAAIARRGSEMSVLRKATPERLSALSDGVFAVLAVAA